MKLTLQLTACSNFQKHYKMKQKNYILLFVCFLTLGLVAQNKVDQNGKKQGPWKKTYPKSIAIQYEGKFKDDKPVGTFIYYYPSRKKQATIKHDDNSPRSYAEFYHESGNILSKGIYINMKKDSIWMNYAPSGRLSSIETFKNDTLNGLKIIYYLPEDLYNKSKMIASKTLYKNGKVDGERIEYFDTGVVKTKGNFTNNIKDGVFITNHPNGKVMNLERYKNGRLHGWCTVNDEAGKEISRVYYFNGERLEGKKLEEKLQYLKNKGINPNE